MGGTLSFRFDVPVYFHDLGLLDMDEADSRLQLTYSDGVVEFFNFYRYGDNSVQRIVIRKPNVKLLELVFDMKSSTAAVTEITYCTECTSQVGHDDSHDCIVDGNSIHKVSEIIEMDDFENSLTALQGWEDGRIDSSHSNSLTKFLGQYTTEVSTPHKIFTVPRDVETIIIELDVYLINTLGENIYGNDIDTTKNGITIFIDGEKIFMELVERTTTKREGKTQLGLTWTFIRNDNPAPQSLGFSTNLGYHIIIEVPSTSQLYADGQLRLTLGSGVSNNATVSASAIGWDNIQLSSRYGCSKLLSSSTNMPATKEDMSSHLTSPSTASTNSPMIFPGDMIELLINPPHTFPVTINPMINWIPTKLPTHRPIPLQ
jgi:hypothetical protein